MTDFKDAESKIKPALFLLIALTVLALLLFRVSIGGDNPLVLRDELTYAAQSQGLWLHQAPPDFAPTTGNWLYLAINSVDFAFNANFLTLARAWNVVSLALCCMFFFLTFRKFAGDAPAGGIIAIVAITFGGSYARMFMPEAMQFTAITIATCAFYQMALRPSCRNAAVVGVAVGLGVLIKVHVIFLIPCFLAGICLAAYVQRLPMRSLGMLCASFLAASLITVFALRFAISGQRDLNLFGNFYGDIAKNNSAGWGQMAQYAYVFKRHLVTLFLMFSPAMAITLIAMAGFRRERTPLNALRCTMLLVALAFGGMLLVSTVFTVSQAKFESLDYIHGRYYEHLLILLAALAALGATKFQQDIGRLTRLGLIVAMGVALVLSYIASRSGMGWQHPTNFVSAFGLYWEPRAHWIALILSTVALALLFLRPALSNIVSVLALLAAVSFSSYKFDQLVTSVPAESSDHAAALIAATDPSLHGDKVVLASPQMSIDVYRAAFHLLRSSPAIQVVPAIDAGNDACPVDVTSANWLLVVSTRHSLVCENFAEVTRFDDAAVYARRVPSSR